MLLLTAMGLASDFTLMFTAGLRSRDVHNKCVKQYYNDLFFIIAMHGFKKLMISLIFSISITKISLTARPEVTWAEGSSSHVRKLELLEDCEKN